MEELISIIVPIYKVEEYLPQCLDSIINQTYKNLEIILVDDGSPDNCPSICDEYAKRDARIKVIHQRNAGLSAARNSGLEIAQGKFIGFVDSDDYIHEKMYEILMQNLNENHADIAVCGVLSFHDPIEQKEWKFVESDTFCSTGLEAMENIHLDDGNVGYYWWTAWNKLYKREIFDNVRYPIGKICEDSFVIHYIYDKAKKVVYTKVRLYFYRKREESIMGSEFNSNRLVDIEALEDRIKFAEQKGYSAVRFKALECCLNKIIDHYLFVNSNPDLTGIKDELISKFDKMYRNLSAGEGLRFKTALKYRLFSISPNIYRFLWSFVKN